MESSNNNGNSRLKLKQEIDDNNQLNESITKTSCSKLSCNKSSTGVSSSSSSPSSTTSSSVSSSSSTSTSTFNQRLIDSQSEFHSTPTSYTPNQYFNANNPAYYHHAFNNLQENHYNSLHQPNQYQETMAYQNVFNNSNTTASQIPLATNTTNAIANTNYQQNIPSSSSSSSSCSSSSSSSASSSSSSSGAFLKYTRPSPTSKPENVCCWIDPDTKKMCNKIFYRMDEIGMPFFITFLLVLFFICFIKV